MSREYTYTHELKWKRRRKTAVAAVCMAALIVLTACGRGEGIDPAKDAEESGAEIVTTSEVKKVEEQEPENYIPEVTELPQPYAKYMEVLELIRDEGRDPNGRGYSSSEDYNFENNCFAILDVDRDGRQELIFNFNESYMAEMREVVYEYDEETDTLREELAEWVHTEYYSQGVVKVNCSHNHGRDPYDRGVWPYSVYEYDSEADCYQRTYMVDPWDGQIYTEDFPDELDTDGDKLLYCVTVENGRMEADAATDGQVMIFDQEEYDAWAEELMPEWSRMEVAYHPMTEGAIENVKSAYTQAVCYAAQAEGWLMEENGEYLLYDLDGDGSLELTSSVMQGTGRYSENHFYGLSDQGKVTELPLVRLCDSMEREWNSDFDIGGRAHIRAYQDKDGIIYYEGNDYTRDGIFGGYDETGFYYLKEGTIYQDSIRQRQEIFHDEEGQEDEVYYCNMTMMADGTAEEITKEQYEAIREDYIRDMTEVRVYQKWVYSLWDEIEQGDDSEEIICRKLFDSFLGSM